MRENMDQKKSEYGRFSCSECSERNYANLISVSLLLSPPFPPQVHICCYDDVREKQVLGALLKLKKSICNCKSKCNSVNKSATV